MSRDFCQIDSVEKLGLERGLVDLRAADHPDRVADIRNLFQFLQCVLGGKKQDLKVQSTLDKKP